MAQSTTASQAKSHVCPVVCIALLTMIWMFREHTRSQSMPSRQHYIQLVFSAKRFSPAKLLTAWDKAFVGFRSKLSKKELEDLDTWDSKQQSTFRDLLHGVESAQKITESKRYRFTATVQKIVQTVNGYAVVADIMIQHNPENTALVWGAFRFILMAAVQEGNTSEKLIDSLDWIARLVFRADEYITLFARKEISARAILQQLENDLVALFTEILIFLFRATAFFQKSSPSKHNTVFPTFLANISSGRYVSAALSPFERRFKEAYGQPTVFPRKFSSSPH